MTPPADARRDARIARQEAHERERRRCLAAAGLTGDAQGLAIAERERDAIDGMDGRLLEGELRRQALDHEQRGVRVGALGQRPLPPADPRRQAGGLVERDGGLMVEWRRRFEWLDTFLGWLLRERSRVSGP